MKSATSPLTLGDLNLRNPFRRLDWRFRRAHQLVAAGSRGGRYDDAYVRATAKFLRGVLGPSRAQQSNPMIAQAEAHAIRQDPDLRARVEAYILARETDEQIAARFGLQPAAIEWYHATSFHVRDRLDATTWVTKTLGATLGARPPRAADGTLTAEQRRLTWRVFGYFGGRHVLDALLGVTARAAPATSADADEWMAARTRTEIRVHSAVEAYWAPLDQPLRLMKLAQKLANASPPTEVMFHDKYAPNIDAFLEGMQPLLDQFKARGGQVAEAADDDVAPEEDGESQSAARVSPPDAASRLRMEFERRQAELARRQEIDPSAPEKN